MADYLYQQSLLLIAFIARISSAPYFLEYVLHRRSLVSVANSVTSVSLGAFFLPYLCRRTSKRNVWGLGLAGSVVGQLIVFAGFIAARSLSS